MAPLHAKLKRARLQIRRADGRPPSQEWLAEQLKVTQAAVSKWESGLQSPSLPMLEAWAGALGLQVQLMPARRA